MLLAAISQSSRAQETNSSGLAQKWQSAREGGSNAWENVKQGSVRAWEDVKQGTTQAWNSATEKFESSTARTNYAFAKKDEFVSKAKAELDDLGQKIKQLADKTESSTNADVKSQMQKPMQVLRSKQDDLTKKYDAAKSATAEDWGKAQAEFQKAYDQTKNSVKEMWDWVKSKTNES